MPPTFGCDSKLDEDASGNSAGESRLFRSQAIPSRLPETQPLHRGSRICPGSDDLYHPLSCDPRRCLARADKADQAAEWIHFLHLRQQCRCFDDLEIQTEVEVFRLNLAGMVRDIRVLRLVVKMNNGKTDRIERGGDQAGAGKFSGLHLSKRFRRIVLVVKREMNKLRQV